MTLHHPKKSKKSKMPWAKGAQIRERIQRAGAPSVASSWHQMSGDDLEGIRLELGLTERDLALLLGIDKWSVAAMRRGPGKIIGATVKLLALLRSMTPSARKSCIAFLTSTQPGPLGSLDAEPDLGLSRENVPTD